MLISDFDYDLPQDLIARYPAADRRGSRLLCVAGEVADLNFADLPSLLRAGDLLVFNDTRVIKARLAAQKSTGGKAEILIERIEDQRSALVHIRASKSPKPGSRLQVQGGAEAEVTGRDGELFALRFSTDILPYLDAHGGVPLPPYLEREADEADIERYQTVYAKDPGAVAAPTAGLHFDEAMLEETRLAGVRHARVTLHVGAGTFQSLREEHIEENRLHSERVEVRQDCVDAVAETRAAGGRVIAVGTTSVRALECASSSGKLQAFDGETDMFIVPGYNFVSVDAMLTNFHLPQSSLLMLVAAFAGKERILAAYAHAVGEKYRFFSYGDAMFLTPARQA
jgi:S-adenosylmethionine:tRNA ribosyltransferase-isomerase